MARTAAPSSYPRRLEQAMRSTIPPVTVRGLAKQLRPDGVESMRRLLRRFLKGERTPGPQVAAEILTALEALGANTDGLDQDDDEDSDQMYSDLLDLCAQLETIGQRLADRVTRKAVA